MALPTATDLKNYLRIETEEYSAESTLLGQLLERATTMVEAWLDRPILTLTDQEYVDEGERDDRRLTRLLIPDYPVDAASVVVEDANGDTVAAADYRVKPLTGEIRADPGVVFANPPYTITCDVGLETHPQYEGRIEPVIAAAILDLAADLYHARDPRATNESAGGGASVSRANQPLPERVQVALQPYRKVTVV